MKTPDSQEENRAFSLFPGLPARCMLRHHSTDCQFPQQKTHGQTGHPPPPPFFSRKKPRTGHILPLDVLYYVYAVLHTPAYQERFKEFLKIDFPRVPWPTDAAQFDKMVALGGRLRGLHLLESEELEKLQTGFPIGGDNLVDKKITFGEGRVRLNQSQYFENVPEVAWQFYIGGYQPAQKWLKDRAGRKLGFEDIMHYQKIIAALARTYELMQQLDEVWGGGAG